MVAPHQEVDPGWVSAQSMVSSPAFHPKRGAQPQPSAGDMRIILKHEVIRNHWDQCYTVIIPSNTSLRRIREQFFYMLTEQMAGTISTRTRGHSPARQDPGGSYDR